MGCEYCHANEDRAYELAEALAREELDHAATKRGRRLLMRRAVIRWVWPEQYDSPEIDGWIERHSDKIDALCESVEKEWEA